MGQRAAPSPATAGHGLAWVARQTIELCRPYLRRAAAPSPALVVWGLMGVIVAGTLLLMLPIAGAGDQATGPLTALFTATSAVCTTGLVVVDTQEHWSLFGEAVLVLLMQVGGLGFLTSSTLILLMMGRRLTLRERLQIHAGMSEGTLGSVLPLVRRIVFFALTVEAAGAVLLALHFWSAASPSAALWHGTFLSVSAFTNASFDLFGGFRSFTGQRDEPFLLLVVSGLIIAGGISYTVVADVLTRRRFRRLALDTKLVLVTTGALLLVGMVGFLALEYSNGESLGALGPGQVLLQSYFFSVVPRTAGFATLNPGDFRDETLFFLIGLMFVGGAAGSTAGGIKVNSLAVLAAAVLSASKGRPRVVAFWREIPTMVVMRALTMATLGLAIVLNAALLLVIVEPFPFLALLFEATSAFGTVGLSTGITPELSTVGQLTLIATMFVGRVGPLALAFALARRQEAMRLRFPEDAVRIG